MPGMDSLHGETPGLMIQNVDKLLGAIPVKCIARFFFSLDDIPYDVQRGRTAKGNAIQITVTLGYIPFSAESVERRQALMDIVAGAGQLQNVRFHVDQQQKIVLIGTYPASSLVSPDFLFFPLIQFLQEAQPFIKLIGQYL